MSSIDRPNRPHNRIADALGEAKRRRERRRRRNQQGDDSASAARWDQSGSSHLAIRQPHFPAVFILCDSRRTDRGTGYAVENRSDHPVTLRLYVNDALPDANGDCWIRCKVVTIAARSQFVCMPKYNAITAVPPEMDQRQVMRILRDKGVMLES
jgi:hypothetical protein